MSVLSQMANKYLQHFVTGLAIGIGFAAFSEAFLFIKENVEKDPMFEGNPSDVDLNFLRFVETGKRVNVIVLLKNKTNQNIDSVNVTAELYDDVGIFGTCRWHYLDFFPKEERQISISCLNFESGNIPKNTKVKLRAGYVDLK